MPIFYLGNRKIKTNAGQGSPAMLEFNKAPGGAQFIVDGKQWMVPEGTLVYFTGRINDNNWAEIVMVGSLFNGQYLMVKSTHLIELEPEPGPEPPTPPVPPPPVPMELDFTFEAETVTTIFGIEIKSKTSGKGKMKLPEAEG